MSTTRRRISFYLKPEIVNSERTACDWLDSLPSAERSRAQRAAFLAGLALIKRNPALAYWLAEWPEDDLPPQFMPAPRSTPTPQPVTEHNRSATLKNNIRTLFPE
ncbi:plasmid partitioning/stability family protein [Escherichia coli]|nr:plasmid partitioning/stability family protein [Escherichia coli]